MNNLIGEAKMLELAQHLEDTAKSLRSNIETEREPSLLLIEKQAFPMFYQGKVVEAFANGLLYAAESIRDVLEENRKHGNGGET